MSCIWCRENIESRIVNGIDVEKILYKCGSTNTFVHTGCVYNFHTEKRWGVGKTCLICQDENPDCNIEDVKAVLETAISLQKLALWQDLGW